MSNDLIYIVLAAFLGALGSGMAGWWNSHEPFDARRFMGTVWRAVFAAMTFALTFQAMELTGLRVYIAAFLGGAGIDVLGNRIQGGMSKESEVDILKRIEADINKVTAIRTPRPPEQPSS